MFITFIFLIHVTSLGNILGKKVTHSHALPLPKPLCLVSIELRQLEDRTPKIL